MWFMVRGCIARYAVHAMSRRCVITIGNFDGVHAGHRALLARARELAPEARVVALTFEPAPQTVLKPEAAPLRLCTAARKVELLREAGADEVVTLTPAHELLNMSPPQFVSAVLLPMQPVAVVEGLDFRFGHNRAGDLALLSKLGAQHGFAVETCPARELALHDGLVTPVHSSLVRWLLARGRVADVQRCLGRAYELTATVVRGEQRGRTLNFPTVNLDLNALAGHALPGAGVYAGWARLADGATALAAISLGMKPTFAGQALVLEAHLLDFAGDLYDQPVTLYFTRFLREQRPFPTPTLLVEQLRRDVAATCRLLTREPQLPPERRSA